MCKCFLQLPTTSYKVDSPILINPGNSREILYPSPFSVNAIILGGLKLTDMILHVRCPLGNLTVNSKEIAKSDGVLVCKNHKLKLLDYTNELYDFEAFGCTRIPKLKIQQQMPYFSMKVSIKMSIVQSFEILNFKFDKKLNSWDQQTTVSTIFRQYLTPLPTNLSKYNTEGIFYNDFIPDLVSRVFSLDYQRQQFSSSSKRNSVDLYFPEYSGVQILFLFKSLVMFFYMHRKK